MEFCFLAGMRNYVDKNYQDQANHNPVTTENKIWLPPSFHNNNKIPIVQAPTPIAPAPKKRRINWGIADKSVWEWLLLLGTLLAALGAIVIPILIYKLGVDFTQQQAQLSIQASKQQHDTDIQIAEDQQRETLLQGYLDRMSDLLLNGHLRESKPGEEVRDVARVRTLETLRRLDPNRREAVLGFLYEAGLIGVSIERREDMLKIYNPVPTIVYLNGADLVDADLIGHILVRADLSYTYLSEADMRGAALLTTNLHGSVLYKANLAGAKLNYADLSKADLTGADLSGADLTGAIVTQQQLDQVSTCKGAILPEGLICHHNQ